MKVAQSCPTPCDPMDYRVHGILQARILEWVAVSSPAKKNVKFKFGKDSSYQIIYSWANFSQSSGGGIAAPTSSLQNGLLSPRPVRLWAKK